MANQLETWVREIHADVREIRSEMNGFRDDIAEAANLEHRVVTLENYKKEYEDQRTRRIQMRIAFAAPMIAAILGSVIAVAPHIP